MSLEDAEKAADREREIALSRYREQLARKRQEAGYGERRRLAASLSSPGKNQTVTTSETGAKETVALSSDEKTAEEDVNDKKIGEKDGGTKSASARSEEQEQRQEEDTNEEKLKIISSLAVDEKVMQARNKYRMMYKSKVKLITSGYYLGCSSLFLSSSLSFLFSFFPLLFLSSSLSFLFSFFPLLFFFSSLFFSSLSSRSFSILFSPCQKKLKLKFKKKLSRARTSLVPELILYKRVSNKVRCC